MRVWDDDMTETLKRLYPDCPTRDLASALGLTIDQVHRKASSLGIKKSQEFMTGPHAHRLRGPEGKATRFKKGKAPWNLGKPGSTGLHPNCKKTQFRKGERHGRAKEIYRPVGSYRISAEGYLEIKVDENPSFQRRWKGVHRLLWEAKFGPIPKGHIVVFKQGMKTTRPDEITLDRLELISRAENMRRNSIHNLPKPVAQAIQMLGALTRKINDVTRKNNQRSA